MNSSQPRLTRPPIYGIELYQEPLLPREEDEVYPQEERFPLERLPADARIHVMNYLQVKEIVLFQQFNKNFKRMYFSDIAGLSILRDSLSDMKMRILAAIDPFFINVSERDAEFSRKLLKVRKSLKEDLEGLKNRCSQPNPSISTLVTEGDKLWGFQYLDEIIRHRIQREEYNYKDILEHDPCFYVSSGYLASSSCGVIISTSLNICATVPPIWALVGSAVGCLTFRIFQRKFEKSTLLSTVKMLHKVNPLIVKEFLSFAELLPLVLPETDQEIFQLHQHIIAWLSIDTNKMVWQSLKDNDALTYWLNIKDFDHSSNPCSAKQDLSLKCTWLVNAVRKIIQAFCHYQNISLPVSFSQINKGSPELTFHSSRNDVIETKNYITKNLTDVNSPEFQPLVLNALRLDQRELLNLFVNAGFKLKSIPTAPLRQFFALLETGIFADTKDKVHMYNANRLLNSMSYPYVFILFINGINIPSIDQFLGYSHFQQYFNFNVIKQIREEGFVQALAQLPLEIKVLIQNIPNFNPLFHGNNIPEFRTLLFKYCLFEIHRKGLLIANLPDHFNELSLENQQHVLMDALYHQLLQ